MDKAKCLLLFSGGLDSLLTFKILCEQGIKIYPIFFDLYFVGKEKVKKWSEMYKIPVKIVDIKEKQLNIVKNPKYGYGKNLNPCIDCKILMFKQAKKIMREKKLDFIATGEVIGQRPFSQKKWALDLIEKESKLQGKIVRPLSGKLLKPTLAEKQGLIKREKFLSIKGKGRNSQMELSKKYNLHNYPSPSGGCLLTDSNFCLKLKEYFKRKIDFDGKEIELLKIGRHLFLHNVKIVVGRDEKENKRIKKLRKRRDILVEMKNYPGPTTLVRFYSPVKDKQKFIEKAKKLTQFYSLKSRNKRDVKFKIW